MMHVKPELDGSWHHDMTRLARRLPETGFFKQLKMHFGGTL